MKFIKVTMNPNQHKESHVEIFYTKKLYQNPHPTYIKKKEKNLQPTSRAATKTTSTTYNPLFTHNPQTTNVKNQHNNQTTFEKQTVNITIETTTTFATTAIDVTLTKPLLQQQQPVQQQNPPSQQQHHQSTSTNHHIIE